MTYWRRTRSAISIGVLCGIALGTAWASDDRAEQRCATAESPQTRTVDALLENAKMGMGTPMYDRGLLPEVVSHLESRDENILIAACALVSVHPSESIAVPKLLKLLDHKSAKVRRQASH